MVTAAEEDLNTCANICHVTRWSPAWGTALVAHLAPHATAAAPKPVHGRYQRTALHAVLTAQPSQLHGTCCTAAVPC